MNSETYDVGNALGRHWAIRDASEDEIRQVGSVADGKTWVADQADAPAAFAALTDPDKTGFMSIGSLPSSSFIAGFIDGAKSAIEQQPPEAGTKA